MKKAKRRHAHKLETVSRACSILRLFDDDRQTLSLTDVVERSGLERTICFRLLHTLEEEGLLRRADLRRYASNISIHNGKRFRIGYCAQSHDSFNNQVGQGLRWAAASNQVDLLELDNQYSVKAALRNADYLVSRHVDLVIEFQIYERIGLKLANQFESAGIPVIAIDIPQPNAVFLGTDNQRAGMLAGKTLVKAVQTHWGGQYDEMLSLDLEIAGSLPQLRISTAQSYLRSRMAGPFIEKHLDTRGEFVRSFDLTRRHLQFVPRRKTLILGINDYAVLGALRAFEEAGRSNSCLAVSFGAGPEARRELRLPNSRLVASIALFPEKYGQSLLHLALDILQKRTVPPAVYMPVEVLTRKNVDNFYPHDIATPYASG